MPLVKHIRASHFRGSEQEPGLAKKPRKDKDLAEVRQGYGASHLMSHLPPAEVRHGELRTIGQRLEHIRTDPKRSQIVMAEKLGIGLRTWQNYERDDRDPDAKTLMGLHALGWSVDWLLTGQGREKVSEAPGAGSHQLSDEHLSIALELADRAIGVGWLPRPRYAQLVRLLYEGITQGLPMAQIEQFARSAAKSLAEGGRVDDGQSQVGGAGEGGSGGGEPPPKAPGQGNW